VLSTEVDATNVELPASLHRRQSSMSPVLNTVASRSEVSISIAHFPEIAPGCPAPDTR
jgi:hypothetical protein